MMLIVKAAKILENDQLKIVHSYYSSHQIFMSLLWTHHYQRRVSFEIIFFFFKKCFECWSFLKVLNSLSEKVGSYCDAFLTGFILPFLLSINLNYVIECQLVVQYIAKTLGWRNNQDLSHVNFCWAHQIFFQKTCEKCQIILVISDLINQRCLHGIFWKLDLGFNI